MTENIIILECFFQINVTMQVMQQYSLSMLENDISVRGEIRSLNATKSVKEICNEMVNMRYLAIVTSKHFFKVGAILRAIGVTMYIFKCLCPCVP